jgi:hypothetical protein
MDQWLVKVNQEVLVVCSFAEAEVVKTEYYLQLGAQVPKVKLFQDEIQMRVRPIEPLAISIQNHARPKTYFPEHQLLCH